MIVLILVAILWIAVLAPAAVSKWRDRRSAGSIGRFHQRLDLLQRTGPKLVEPAYRLTGTEGGASTSPLVVQAPPPAVRPNLVLLRGDEEESMSNDSPMAEPVYRWTTDEEAVVPLRPLPEMEEEFRYDRPVTRADAFGVIEPIELQAINRRNEARRRRRNVFGALCAMTALTALLGLAHPLRFAWILSAVSFLLLVVFVGLAVLAQRVQTEQRHVARLQRSGRAERWVNGDTPMVNYLSEDELAQYHEVSPLYDEPEDDPLIAEG